MELLEKGGLIGVGAKPVKLGSGDKEKGYAFRVITLKRIAFGIFVCGCILLSGTVAQHFRLVLAQRQYVNAKIQQDSLSIAQNMQLEAALSAQLQAKDDVLRVLKRIKSVTNTKIEEALNLIPTDQADVRIKVADVLNAVEVYVDSEKEDYVKEAAEKEDKTRGQLEALRKKQITALEKLLNQVTEVKLEALEELLEDLFERAEDSLEVSLPEYMWIDLENLVDELYQETITLEKGKEEFDIKFRPNFMGQGIPHDINNRLANANNHGDLADVMDEILEGVQIYKGRAKVAEIAKEWKDAQNKADEASPTDSEAVEKAEKTYTKATVDAIIKIQEMINQGLLQQDVLDFDEISLDDQIETNGMVK